MPKCKKFNYTEILDGWVKIEKTPKNVNKLCHIIKGWSHLEEIILVHGCEYPKMTE